jgi:hypothetical protein
VGRFIPDLVEDRVLRARLAEEIATVAEEFRVKRDQVADQIPIEPI